MKQTWFKRLLALALCVMLVLIAALPAGADFGDYSGDSDFGDSSDWSSSDSSWDSSDWDSDSYADSSDGGTPGLSFWVIGIILMSFYGIRCLSAVIRHALEKYLTRSNDPEDTGRTIKGLFPIINIIIWSVGTIFLLDNLGFNISAVVAGLGIGEIIITFSIL